MFLGQHEHTLDEKGRLTIPSKYRDDLVKGLVVTRGLDGCLHIYTMDGWNIYAASLDGLPPTKKLVRSFSRFTFSGANDLIPDRQGRILLPGYLRDYAGLDGDVVIIGAKDHLEVWAAERWQQIREEVEQNAETIAEELFNLKS